MRRTARKRERKSKGRKKRKREKERARVRAISIARARVRATALFVLIMLYLRRLLPAPAQAGERSFALQFIAIPDHTSVGVAATISLAKHSGFRSQSVDRSSATSLSLLQVKPESPLVPQIQSTFGISFRATTDYQYFTTQSIQTGARKAILLRRASQHTTIGIHKINL